MRPFLIALTIACAFGAGITGTLLWMQNRSAPPAKTTVPEPAAAALPNIPLPNIPASNAVQPVVPQGQVAQGGSEVPPSNLTSGMASGEAALTLGNWNYDHENWGEAVQNYRAAIAGGLDNPNIRTDLGNSLRFSDHPQDALVQYQTAQKQDPTHEQSLFNQGALYAVSLKNTRRGIEAWHVYLKRFPNGGTAKQARELIAKFSKTK